MSRSHIVVTAVMLTLLGIHGDLSIFAWDRAPLGPYA